MYRLYYINTLLQNSVNNFPVDNFENMNDAIIIHVLIMFQLPFLVIFYKSRCSAAYSRLDILDKSQTLWRINTQSHFGFCSDP